MKSAQLLLRTLYDERQLFLATDLFIAQPVSFSRDLLASLCLKMELIVLHLHLHLEISCHRVCSRSFLLLQMALYCVPLYVFPLVCQIVNVVVYAFVIEMMSVLILAGL